MLIVLPPSEGKTRPDSGPVLDLDGLSFPELNKTRDLLVRTLIKVSATRRAADVLGLGPTQADALAINVNLPAEPTARADAVFTGVLFEAADLASLDTSARRRADDSIVICNGLFGLVRPGDLIPAYRLAGNAALPRIGTVTSRWKPTIPKALDDVSDGGLVIDLRSGTYAAFGSAPAERTATMRVLQERDGRRSVVSHFNKATKGRIVRTLLESGASPTTPSELAGTLRDLGWTIEHDGPRLDVIVTRY